jgi:hypothetical protein
VKILDFAAVDPSEPSSNNTVSMICGIRSQMLRGDSLVVCTFIDGGRSAVIALRGEPEMVEVGKRGGTPAVAFRVRSEADLPKLRGA